MKGRILVTIAAAVTLSGCITAPEAPPPPAEPRIRVTTSVYALQWLVEQVGGSFVDVTTLSIDPHGDEQIAGPDLEALKQSDLHFYVGNLSPSDRELVNQKPAKDQRIDVASPDLQPLRADPDLAEESVDGFDPHVWLDPAKMKLIASNVQGALALAIRDNEALAAKQKTAGDTFSANLNETNDKLDKMRNRMLEALRNCQGKALVTEHPAFQYVTAMAGMRQVSLKNIFNRELPEEVRNKKFADVEAEYAQLQAGGVKRTAFADVGSTRAVDAEAARDDAEEARSLLLEVQRRWRTEIVYLETLESRPESVTANEPLDYEKAMLKNARDIALGLSCASPESTPPTSVAATSSSSPSTSAEPSAGG